MQRFSSAFIKYLLLICPILVVLTAMIYGRITGALPVFGQIWQSPSASLVEGKAYLALVIDDFGNGRDGTEEFMSSDIPFTAAVMPNMPYTLTESLALYQQGRDIILHMPMMPKNGKISGLGDVYLAEGFSNEHLKDKLTDSLDQLYGVIGINNHMGSGTMESERVMAQLAAVAKERGLFILDSKTTARSPIHQLGEAAGITVLSRNVFLDGTHDVSIIKKNLMTAAKVAQKEGYCIAIGHVGQAGGKPTIQTILDSREELEAMNIQLITLSQLLAFLEADTMAAIQ